MFRFSYLLPRLAILCLLWVASEYGAAWLLKWSITSGGPTLTGAKVDVAEAHASLLHTRVAIKGLQVADSNRAMHNLASVELVELNLDTAALLRKKAVVNHGIVRGLRFGTPRATSGQLAPTAAVAPRATRSTPFDTTAASDLAANWLADIQQKLSFDARQQLESIRLAEELAAKWPAEYTALSTAAQQLKTDVERLTADTNAANQNPLRNAEFLRALPGRVKALQQQTADLQSRLQALPGLVEADRQRVLAARDRDERFLREKLSIKTLDPVDLTAFLLNEQLQAPVGELVEWLRWVRKLVPSKSSAPKPVRSRGEDILFAGVKRYPDLLVRAIDLHGVAKLGGRPLEIAGTLNDFTTQPQLHGKPLQLRLVTRGALPIQVQAVIDRTADTPRDELLAVCNGLAVPGLQLGDSTQMALNVGPSTAAVQIAIRLDGETLAGNVEVLQKQVQIKPVIAQRFGAPEIQQALHDSLARVDEVSTRIAMSGILLKPHIEINSTLGLAVQSAIHNTVVAVIEQQREKLLAAAQQETEKHLVAVRCATESATAQIAPLLAQPEEMLAKLLGPDLAKPFSADQFGRLPAGSLFK
jgi:uncharacterized protein (TIGR03545 family)